MATKRRAGSRPGIRRRGPAVDPGELRDFRRGAEWALAAATAHELGIFRGLADGPRPLETLSAELESDPRGLRILLGACRDLGLVRPAEDGWRLTGQGRARFLDRETPDFEGDAMRQWLASIRRWAVGLPEAVREGEPPPEEGRAGDPWGEDEEERMERFMAAMAGKDPALVRKVVGVLLDRLDGSGSPARAETDAGDGGGPPAEDRARILDLGGGPGTFSRELLRRGARVVLLDRPEVIDHVSDRYGLASLERLELRAGDFLEELPEGPFDGVLVANITHIYDPETNASLLARIRDRLRPGGAVAILDFVRGISDFAGLFAITMLLNTERGDTYARADYEDWLEAAGLARVRVVSVDPERQVVSAVRPSPEAREEGSRTGAEA